MLSDLFFDVTALGLPDYTQPIPWIISALWAVFILELIGLIQVPNIVGRGDLIGIFTYHFGHANLRHIAGNTVGITLLLFLYFRHVEQDTFVGLAAMAVGSGALYWLFGRGDREGRGASGFMFALGGWWCAYQLLTGKVIGFGIVIFIMFAYGFFESMSPFPGEGRTSLQGHFWGFVAGILWAAWSLGWVERWLQA